ncbi:MAG: DMT family protein [Bdellovibrionales bacterium]
MIKVIVLLLLSNVFMTFAWYGHLKNLKDKPLYIAILISWFIAFLEYCLQVPANRIGTQHMSLSVK